MVVRVRGGQQQWCRGWRAFKCHRFVVVAVRVVGLGRRRAVPWRISCQSRSGDAWSSVRWRVVLSDCLYGGNVCSLEQ